jgi:hypothetical protein
MEHTAHIARLVAELDALNRQDGISYHWLEYNAETAAGMAQVVEEGKSREGKYEAKLLELRAIPAEWSREDWDEFRAECLETQPKLYAKFRGLLGMPL